MKDWKIPFTILILLILAMIFRWSDKENYIQDNWNGAGYRDYYTVDGANHKTLVRTPFTESNSEEFTIYWGVMLTGTLSWLLIMIPNKRKYK